MRKLIWFLPLFLFSMVGCDSLYEIANEVYTQEPSSLEMSNGLKQALDNGINYAVGTLSKEGGYFNDPLVKIPFPEEAQFAADALQKIGLGGLVTDFEKRLNRGAEEGAKEALSIFGNAIKQMTFSDVKNILLGGENSATNFFRNKTEQALYDKFSPKIKTSLDQVNATKVWTDITTKYNSIPFTRNKVETDLVKYATNKAMDGLFLKVAEEEKKIRENPVARTSELLRSVFGYADKQKQASNG
ncbi:MAG: DUF4197 domain-containing protein [Bacteroidota bacterium]